MATAPKSATEGFLIALLVLSAAVLSWGIYDAVRDRTIHVGDRAPGFRLSTNTGQAVTETSFGGELLLVNFWATWCEPCREEMPSMNRLRASLPGRPFEVLAVNIAESESRIRRFMEQVPLDFPVLMDRDNAASKAWRARVLPVSFLVGPDGRIRHFAVGEIDWAADRVRQVVLEMLPRTATQSRAALSASFP